MNTAARHHATAPSILESVDVAIVGGGAAGLAAAVALGRSLRSVVVVDAGAQRNLPADAAHNVLAREGDSPAEIIARGRAEAVAVGVVLADDTVVSAARDGDFHLDLQSGRTVRARRLILATGLVDVLPDIPGVREAWGHGVLHCPYCHGYEVRGRRIGVIASDPIVAVHQALLFAQLSDQVTLFVNGVDCDARRADLAARGVDVVDGTVTRVVGADREVSGIVVDGVEHPVDHAVVGSRMTARTDLYEQLGGTREDHPFGYFIPSGDRGRTPVDGVWTAGNAGDLSAMVAVAAAAGLTAGVAINADLVDDDLRRARGDSAE